MYSKGKSDKKVSSSKTKLTVLHDVSYVIGLNFEAQLHPTLLSVTVTLSSDLSSESYYKFYH